MKSREISDNVSTVTWPNKQYPVVCDWTVILWRQRPMNVPNAVLQAYFRLSKNNGAIKTNGIAKELSGSSVIWIPKQSRIVLRSTSILTQIANRRGKCIRLDEKLRSQRSGRTTANRKALVERRIRGWL